MSAYHRFVLEAPPGTIVPPYHAIFAIQGEKTKFRGDRPVPRLAGTHMVNLYHLDKIRENLEKLDPRTRRTLSEDVKKMINNKKPANEIGEEICKKLETTTESEMAQVKNTTPTRKTCKDYYVEQEGIFLGISIGMQTAGHLQSHGLIEVHVVVAGCCRLRVESTATLRVGDAIFTQVPLFKQRTLPICSVVAGISETDVLVSIDAHDIGTT